MNKFESQLLRLKQTVGITADQDVAALLGMSKAAFSDRKKREAFPDDKLGALAAKRPDLRIDVAYVLTGERLSDRQRQMTDAARQATLSAAMNEEDRERLLQLLAQSEEDMGKQTAIRRDQYMQITEMLNDCTDSTVKLVIQAVTLFRQADMAAKSKSKGKAA